MQIPDYCRDIEDYLCRKNDGHLIRVVGPSFDLVSGWAAKGIPLKVALRGIDRYFERYYSKGPRRRPVRIDFCEADVLDVFDEWRRALGVAAPAAEGDTATVDGVRRGPSLPAHLERVVRRLTQARARGSLGAAFDEMIDRVARELDVAREGSRGVRGDSRRALVDRLAALDRELVQAARASLDAGTGAALAREAEDEIAAYRASMTPEAFGRARDAALDRTVRERFGLPIIAFI